MFKKKFPSLSSLGSDGNTSFLRAARAGHLDKVLDQLDKNNVDINTSNANGLNALHLASKDGHVHVVTELLKRGANVDSATKKGNTALHIASLAGQEDVVRLLVDNGASVNVQSQNGFTPLYMAAQENHDNVVKFLLASGANQSLATEDGFTPLAVAMQQGHDKIVAVLLENDSRGKVRLPALHIAAKKDDCKAAALLLQNEHNPDVTSKSGFTPLHIASHYGNEGIANLLLTKGADVNYSAKHNITPLHVAAKWGKSNMVSLLLEKGANIESKTRDGLTPLHCAARSGHEQVVDMLLERGAPISSKTKNGLAPLHMSSQGDHVDAARILLYHRAPVDEVTVDYLTALHVAAHCGHARVAKLLLDRKADPNARALNGFTPLHIACKKNRIKVVELLLKHGASIEATTESGLTPLHVASFMGCMNIVIYLLQNEANPDVPTVRGETPLHLAARANQTDIIRILLRNGAQVDARAREQQTPLHIAARLGNFDIVTLLLQHGAAVDSTTKDLYTALHIATKEGQDEVASVLIEHAASLTATTKKGFTPLHLAAKYGNIKVARLLLQRDAPVDAQGKNGVTPLHVASHYDHQNVALLLLEKGASPHATAKNGHTPLHIAAKKNQMDIATTLLEYGAKSNSESKAGFTPLHLSSQEGHTDMSSLLIDHSADTNKEAKNGLTPLHLCAQEDRVDVAAVLVENGAKVDSTTKAGYTPLHVASHFGQLNMVRFLVQQQSDVGATTAVGYTPLHQAAQQGHATIVSHLLDNGAPPNEKTNQGQTALSIAQKLGYISVVEALKGVTEPSTITAIGSEEKYKVVSPETMQETFMSDSEDEGGEDTLLSEQPYRYLTVDEMKSLGDDSLPIDVTRDERFDSNRECMSVPPTAVDDTISPQHLKENYNQFITPDNVDIAKHPLHVGFLVSFLVDARGGAMRGCRHSGVRVIVPPRRAAMPMRVTCRYLKRDKLPHPPPLMEGEALASRILELGPVAAKFLGPVMIEVPHFGSLRGKEREIVILRSDNGETWREHTVEATDEAVQDVLSHSFEKEEMVQAQAEEGSSRTTRILTTDFPHYFAVVSRVRQEVHAIGPEGGMVSSSVVPQVQAVFPQGALTKKIKVGLQAQPIPAELAAKLLGNRVAVSPIVTVEPRRRKFHKPITLTIPVPQAANKGMINQYSGDAPTLRLLCSITGGTTRAQWEDVTGSTPLTFVNDCVSFTTTVSARFWLMDCRNISDATKMATELYREAIHVPFMAKFVVFAKRIDILEARLRVFCMTDDKEDKTLEHQEHFTEVAKSRDVEVLEGKPQYVEFAANLVPVTKSGDQLQLGFRAFRENRLPFTVRVKDPHAEPIGRTLFMREPKIPKGEAPQQPICVLNIVLPEEIIPETSLPDQDLHKYSFIKDSSGLESYQRADLRLSDISNLLGEDWMHLAEELGVSVSDINRLKSECPGSVAQQGLAMLRFWVHQADNKASANTLEAALSHIGREDIVQQCIYNLDQTNFELLKDDRAPSREVTTKKSIALDRAYEDNIRKAEAEELRRVQERILQRAEGKEIEKDDKEESKYVAEEKEVEEEEEEVEEVKKSVSERRKEIEMRLSQEKEKVPKLEKRLSQETKVLTEKEMITSDSTKILDQPSEKEIAEEKKFEPDNEVPEPAELSFAEKRLSFEKGLKQDALKKADDKTVDSQKFIFEEQKVTVQSVAPAEVPPRKTVEQEVSGKVKESETFESVEKRKTTETIAYSDDRNVVISNDQTVPSQRRDSQLMEGVTETFDRLGMTAYAPQPQDLLSPKVSKTPPPSPAEFKDTTAGTTAWEETATAQLTQAKSQTATDWANKSGKPDAAAIDHGTSTISEKDTSKITENVREASLPSSKIDETGISFTTKQETSEHTTKEEKLREEDKNSKSLPSLAEENSKFIKEESTIIQKVISNEKPFKIEPISSEAGKNGNAVNKIDIPVIDTKSETNKFDLTNIIERDEGEDFKHSEEEKQQSIPIELTSKNREGILNECIATKVSSFSPHQSSDFDTKETPKLQGADGKQVIEKDLDTNNSKNKNDLAFMNNERTSTLTSEIINENTHSPRDTVLQFLKTEAIETSVHESESASRDKKLTNIVYDMLIDQETSNSQFHDKVQSKQNLEVKNAHEENITVDDIQQTVPNKSRLDSSEEMIKGIAAKPEVTIPHENAISFVTTPTMQRKKIGGSQRLSREERPALREVTHVVDYNSSEDSEECDDKGYTVTEPTERDREQEFLQDRKVTFKIESEDEEEKLDDVVGVEFEEVGNDEVISNKQGSQINVKRQMIDQELVTVGGASQDLIDAKPTKIERRFERMASETIEQNAESTVSTEGEFQRMVSQLSTEEVDEYLQLWDEGGLTPSSELDSRDATVESADMDEEVEAIPQESSWSVSQEQEQRPTDTSEFSPKPPPRTTTKPEPCIDNSVKQPEICQQPDLEDAQDYSIKKKFWEQISSSGEAEVKIAKHPEPTAPPPVPRPRSSIVSSVSLLKSEAESDTETTITTLSDSTIRLKNVQQDALSKHSFTGSSDASDKEEVSETDAAESILPVSVPATVSSAVVESTEEQDKQPLLSSSSDSESEHNLKSNDKPSPAKKSFSLDTEKKSKIPVVATRKTVYERSVSLPTSDLDSSISSVRAKKRYFEAQIKKEMVVDQLMTQLEEESSPEHKSINQKENEKPTADAEAMVSRQIHSHIFSHEMDEQIESLVPESKHILEAEEALVGKPVTVTEVAEVNNKVDARRTVKRTDSTLFEAEIVKLEPVMKEAKEESSITLDNVITNNVKNMKNIFENFSEQPSLEKSITEPEEYSSAETKRIFDEQNICNDFIEEKTSTSLSSMPEKLEFGSGDLPNQTSDSMEVHIDKSEIEESEKEKDTEEMLKQEEYSNLVKDKIMLEEDEPIPSITVTLSGKQRTDSYSPADSEDNQSEADIVPEHSSTEEKAQKVLESQLKFAKTSSESREPCVHTPEEHFPDTVWEVPVQQEPETSEQEVAHDIPIESQIIVEKDEEDSLSSDIKQFQSILNKNRISISEEEAREIAEQVVEDIEAKIAEKNIIINDTKVDIGSMNKEVTEYFKQLSTEEVDEKLIESVIAKKQREQIMKASRKDTTTSSMEITDEDLRSSGVDTDISLIDSFPSKLKHLDEKSETDEASGSDNLKSNVEGALMDKDVLEKTLAEVKESLEAAQEELIEEHKKKQDKIDKKESPSEFEFKVMSIDRLKDESIQESYNEDVLSTHESEELGNKMSAQSTSKSDGDGGVDIASSKGEIEDGRQEFYVDHQDEAISTTTTTTTFSTVQENAVESELHESTKIESQIDISTKASIHTTNKTIETSSSSKEEKYEVFDSYEEEQKLGLIHEDCREERSGEVSSKLNYVSTQRSEFTSKINMSENITDQIESSVTRENMGFEGEKLISGFEDSQILTESKEKPISHMSEDISVMKVQEQSNFVESSEFSAIDSTTQVSVSDERETVASNTQSEHDEFVPKISKEDMKRAFSDESQKSSQDESIKSPVGIEEALSSSSSSGRKGDSDTMHTLGKPGVVMRKHKTGINSAERVSSRYERRSGTDYEPYSSSGESHYQSFEQTSESMRTPSRPCSSDIEGLMVGVAGTTGSSEYESAISHEASAQSGTSHEFHTAVSSLSSRESMKSLDSESSGNLASVEISSEASETLVPSAMELERDMEGVTGPVSDYYSPPSRRFTEPYEMDIPHHVIRGESPHNIRSMSDEKDSASFDNSADDLISEEDIELEKDKIDDGIPTKMKRSHEMIFQPDLRPASDSPVTEITDDKLASSLEEATSVISSMSSVSDNAVKTVLEISRTESDRMDGSVTSDQLSLTVSGTSEQLSLSSESHEEPILQKINRIESSTSTQPTTYTDSVSSVTITTSMIKEQGIQSVCTQVTSQSETSKSASEDVIQTVCHTNGPSAVQYKTEYDEIKEPRKKPGHRRNESTTFKPSMIPVLSKKSDSKSPKSVEGRLSGYTIEDTAESDKYGILSNLTTKEGRNDEKKDIDESEKLEEESYQTEADQGFHREMREARLTMDDSAFCAGDEHEETKESPASRPQSQVSKSDSEGGQRLMSSEISDDRPDSELIELMKQCSSDTNIDDPIERPRTPEPPEEPEIKDDTPEFSSEAQASITELELEYCGAFSRSIEYEAHVSPIHEKPYISFEAQDHQDDMAEAEAAFHMVPHISPTIPSVLPATIPEDPIAEKHELETREIALKEEMRRRSILAEATSPGSIPDITVTQHMAPLVDREFHYPDLELEAEEVAATGSKEESTPDTPASLSSKASTESEADQGREYIIDEPDGEDYIAEEPDTAELSMTTEDKTEMETKHETMIERDSATNSPGSDSFELLEKPDLADDFVIIEEVGKEAQEQDVEGKSVRIGPRRIIKKAIPDDEVKSPPAPATKMTDLKYYPPVKDDLGPFPFESESPPTGDDVQQSAESEEGSPPSDEVQTYENEVEAGKKWIEMQFQGEQAAAVYGYEFEHGPLEDIKEEEATDFESSSKIGSVGSQVSHSVGSFGSVKESLSSTPDYDVLAGRKYFTRSGEHDDVSMSSLQEFERIEHMIALESTKNKSLGSQDSLSGSGGSSRKHGTNRSGGDDISLSSLKEFEGLEMACIAAEKIESKAKEEEALLSEIEEGHESQASESESCETISAGGIKGGDSDSDDYEKRMFEIDEIIKQAQTNVERFTDLKDATEVSFLDKTESVGRGDSLEEVAKVPDLDLDQPLHSASSASKAYDSSSYTKHWVDENRQTTDSLERVEKLKIEPDQFTISTDSLDMKTGDKTSADAMSASTDSIEYQLQQKKSKGRSEIMTDSIELSNKSNIMSDSLDLDTVKHTDSIEDDDEACGNAAGIHDQSSSSGREGDLSSSGKEDSGENNRIPPPRAELMLGSTDSLEPTSSTATHATYHYETDSIMSSSFTSGGSNTMVSSTETLDAAARAEVWFEDGKPYVTEVIEPETDEDFSHIIHRTVELPPEIHKVTFQGPDADKALREYVEKFGPGEDMSETQHVDEHGNVHIKRVVQRRVVIKPEQMSGAAAGLSGPELEQYIKHLSEEQMLGEMEPLEEQTGMTESDYSHLISSASSPPHSSESHQEYFSRHIVSRSSVSTPSTSITTTKKEISLIQQKGEKSPSGEVKAPAASSGEPAGTRVSSVRSQRPSLKYDISMDEDPEFDPREHDWRFNLEPHFEGDESPDDKVAPDNSSITDKLLASGATGANTTSSSK